jgi:hypothetical protein
VPAVPVPRWPENGARTSSWIPDPDTGTIVPVVPTLYWELAPDGCADPTFDVEVGSECAGPGGRECEPVAPQATATGIAETEWEPAASLEVNETAPRGRRYYWRVRACRGEACSAWSDARYVDVGSQHNDFDGDGRADLVVGAPNASALRGAVYVYLGGAEIEECGSCRFHGAETDGRFGHAVAAAGDVNADGYVDLLVGAPGADSGLGQAVLRLGAGSGAGPTCPLERPESVHAGFGTAVAGAGDVDGDGTADFLVGAADCGGGAGCVRLWFGRVWEAGEPGDCGTALEDRRIDLAAPDTEARGFGKALTGVGDIDGDGFADIAVGAPEADVGGLTAAGKVYVYHGPDPAGLAADPVIDGRAAGGLLGTSLAGRADVDGDRRADLLVGEPGAPGTAGALLLFRGGSSWAAGPDVEFRARSGGGLEGLGRLVAAGLNPNETSFFLVAGAGGEGTVFAFRLRDLEALVGPVLLPTSGGGSAGVEQHELTRDSAVGPATGEVGSLAAAGDVNLDGRGDAVVGFPEHGDGGTSGRVLLYRDWNPAGGDETGNLALDGTGDDEFGFAVW